MAVITVQRKPLTLAERTYLPQIASGLKTTWKVTTPVATCPNADPEGREDFFVQIDRNPPGIDTAATRSDSDEPVADPMLAFR